MVGLIIDAAEEAGSIDAMLLRIDGMDTLESVRNGHEGGDSGDTGLDRSVLLARGVGASSSVGVCTGVELALESGDFFISEVFLSLPFPSTVLRNEPFRFLLLL